MGETKGPPQQRCAGCTQLEGLLAAHRSLTRGSKREQRAWQLQWLAEARQLSPAPNTNGPGAAVGGGAGAAVGAVAAAGREQSRLAAQLSYPCSNLYLACAAPQQKLFKSQQ